MMRSLPILALVLALALSGAGCTTTQGVEQTELSGNYWPLDSLSMVYADPVAVSPLHDHPFRWLSFLVHPVGVVLDYAVNRPVYAIASAFPTLFGYNAEDAGHQARRSGQSYQ
jgi:hypothetical protein